MQTEYSMYKNGYNNGNKISQDIQVILDNDQNQI
jgi:hypothetical protein